MGFPYAGFLLSPPLPYPMAETRNPLDITAHTLISEISPPFDPLMFLDAEDFAGPPPVSDWIGPVIPPIRPDSHVSPSDRRSDNPTISVSGAAGGSFLQQNPEIRRLRVFVCDSGAMQTVHIAAKPDHLLRLAKQKDPVGAVAEMIWNALDAEAHRIDVDIEVNDLGGVEFVSIADDGHGMPNAACARYFGGLGGSWKTTAKISPDLKRGLHGRSGQGRLRAFALGTQVRWATVAEAPDGRRELTVISGTIDRPTDFDISASNEAREPTATRVEASGPADYVDRLVEDDTARHLASVFAPFLAANPDVAITYRGEPLDPSTVWVDTKEYPLVWEDNEEFGPIRLRVIEWEKDVGRVLALCDANGVVLDEIPPGIQAPGYHFTAYLLWDGFVERREPRNRRSDARPRSSGKHRP
jgi:Histidine kinase-, DNA gyrase B-, and HSP90-like ATPase